jgi:FtsP/CotA-like multicopper oxidase with cupredoxin domain
MNLQTATSHRLRLINVGGFAWFQVSIDHHPNLQVIEVDGTTVEPAVEEYVAISPGQRYSIVVTADVGDYDAYWLRARMIKHCFSTPKLPENGTDEALAIIRYATAQDQDKASDKAQAQTRLPTTENTVTEYLTQCKDMTSSRAYHPFPPKPAPESASHSWYLRVNLAIGDWRLERGFINESSLRPKLQSPTLHRLVDGLSGPRPDASFAVQGVNTAAFDPSEELVISHAGIETVDMVVQNLDEGNHPFHLHGTQLWVLGQGHAYFPGYAALGLDDDDEEAKANGTRASVVANPLRRDTVTVEGFGWALLRFVADNPGVWLFHCHMAWHSEAGMGMQFVSRLDDLGRMAVPSEHRDLCGAGIEELEKGAPPRDEVFFGFHDG